MTQSAREIVREYDEFTAELTEALEDDSDPTWVSFVRALTTGREQNLRLNLSPAARACKVAALRATGCTRLLSMSLLLTHERPGWEHTAFASPQLGVVLPRDAARALTQRRARGLWSPAEARHLLTHEYVHLTQPLGERPDNAVDAPLDDPDEIVCEAVTDWLACHGLRRQPSATMLYHEERALIAELLDCTGHPLDTARALSQTDWYERVPELSRRLAVSEAELRSGLRGGRASTAYQALACHARRTPERGT